MADTFKNYSPTELAILITAITKARVLSTRAWNDNLIHRSYQDAALPEYQDWFGEITKSRFDKVRRNVGIINYAIHSQKITWERVNGDPQNFAAALMPTGGWNEQKVKQIIDSGYTVEIDDLFYATTDDETYNTIIHEISHIVANTDDETNPNTTNDAYGRVECTNLKTYNPDIAINNADSYGYFHLAFN